MTRSILVTRSHALRGNAVLDASRPSFYKFASNCLLLPLLNGTQSVMVRIPTQSVGTRKGMKYRIMNKEQGMSKKKNSLFEIPCSKFDILYLNPLLAPLLPCGSKDAGLAVGAMIS